MPGALLGALQVLALGPYGTLNEVGVPLDKGEVLKL